MSSGHRFLWRLDYDKMSFPSDNITLKTFVNVAAKRHGMPILTKGQFEAKNKNKERWNPEIVGARFLGGELIGFILAERELADQAFNAAIEGYKPSRIGKQALQSAWWRKGVIVSLDAFYQRNGVSGGTQESLQLIRGIESQAVAQAEEYVGRAR